MTIGILTYTNDQRYQALHTEGSDEWSLRISSAQTRDSGVFECQISTEPKISQSYRLNVVGRFKMLMKGLHFLLWNEMEEKILLLLRTHFLAFSVYLINKTLLVYAMSDWNCVTSRNGNGNV